MQVNTAAPVSQMGSVNGAGQTLASLVRALGPATGGESTNLTVRSLSFDRRGLSCGKLLSLVVLGVLNAARRPTCQLLCCFPGAAWGASLSLGPPAGQFLPFAAVAAAFLATQLLYRQVAIPGV